MIKDKNYLHPQNLKFKSLHFDYKYIVLLLWHYKLSFYIT